MDLEAKSPLYSNFIKSYHHQRIWMGLEERNLDLLDASQRPFYMLFYIQRWLTLVLDLTVAGLDCLDCTRERLDTGLVDLGLLNVVNFNIGLTQIIKFTAMAPKSSSSPSP
jgi:ATP-binding cassette, subfamily C (CFTR/MRP), member 1